MSLLLVSHSTPIHTATIGSTLSSGRSCITSRHITSQHPLSLTLTLILTIPSPSVLPFAKCQSNNWLLRRSMRGDAMLQAPVSDREQVAGLPETASLIKEARARLGGAELMPAAATDAPITPERFLSLTTKVTRQKTIPLTYFEVYPTAQRGGCWNAWLQREEISYFACSPHCLTFAIVENCSTVILTVHHAAGHACRGVSILMKGHSSNSSSSRRSTICCTRRQHWS